MNIKIIIQIYMYSNTRPGYTPVSFHETHVNDCYENQGMKDYCGIIIDPK